MIRAAARTLLRLTACLAAVPLLGGPAAPTQHLSEVDLNLVLAIDCSSSVDDAEFRLQVTGLANALRSPDVLEAIRAGPIGAISVAVVQWSAEGRQFVTVPWTVVHSADDAATAAEAVAAQARLTAEGATSISAMIGFGAELIARSPVPAARNVIDIAADGANNNGMRVDRARDIAISQGIVVNGLTVLNEVQYLQYYFQNHVIGGPGAFVEIAENYSDFERAMRRKLLREIRANSVS